MSESPSNTDTRAVAAQILGELLQGRGSLSQLLPNYSSILAARERAFVSELCFGVMRFHPRLNGLVKQLLNKPLKPRDSDIQALLLLGCYQLSYMRVPDHAAISATVAATGKLNKPWAKGLTNGVLRNYQRHQTRLVAKLSEADSLSHPPWLLEKIRRQWPSQAADIVEANNNPPPMSLRINLNLNTRTAYLEQLGEVDIAARACLFSASGIQLESPVDVSQLPGFEHGACSVQDEASQLVAPLLRPESAGRILDSCCAPGGKTSHLLELAGGLDLDAVDIDDRRLQRVEQNLKRLGQSARLIHADASDPRQWWNGVPYDAILLDAPCSATGVIRRHPDIKVLRRATDLLKLNGLQLKLLTGLWPIIRPGGRLIYTTCSILQEENDQVLEAFINSKPDAHCESIDAEWGTALRYGRQLLPQKSGPDGFYYASLRKTQAPAQTL